MDSGNSGSRQSSSTGGGGDEEYDSRVESSLSALLNNDSSLPPSSSRNISRFPSVVNNNNNDMSGYPLSNYMDPIQRSYQNIDMWSKTVRSEPNQSNFVGLMPSSITSNNQQGFLSSVGVGVATFPTTHNSCMAPPQENGSRGLLLCEDQGHNYNKSTNSNMVRNPKKRSRASRRAPTTVLTTDTTNFRAMVQEFTGIPALQPFTSSPFQRTRLDLFASSSTIRSLDITPQPPPTQPPYLLRPFAQKLHPFPPSMLDNNNNNTLLGNSNHSSTNLSTNPTQFMMNMQTNQILSLESILQGQQAPKNSKYTLGNSSKTQPPFEIPNTSVDNSHLKMSVLEELGLSHDHVNNIASSSSGAALSSRFNNNNNNINDPSSSSSNWVQRTGTTIISNNNNGGDDDDDHGSYANNIHHGDKGPECGVAARSEGMVESWINCSSD
ncbi:unnamed protein product [Lupinus luteus]|uniref:VQ domain-containing protein n=1 Tax=Lupinus luteus TaxID=3873 RepID=A0AAV1YGT4_LUPLU